MKALKNWWLTLRIKALSWDIHEAKRLHREYKAMEKEKAMLVARRMRL